MNNSVVPLPATRLVRWIALSSFSILSALAAEPALPAEPELFGREPKLQLSRSALVFDEGAVLRVPEAQIEQLFPGPDGMPLAKLHPTTDTPAPRIRAESVKLWIGRQHVPVEVLSTKPSSTRGEFEVRLFLPLPPDLKTDTYKAGEAKESIKRRVAHLQEWSTLGLFGRQLPVTVQLTFTWQDAPGGRVSRPLLLHDEVIVRTIPYSVSAVALALMVFAVVLAFFAARSSLLLFDGTPVEFNDAQGQIVTRRWQYSLSRVQGFGWLLVVFFGVLFIYATTGSLLDVMNPTALALLAIGSGTAFVGLLLDQGRETPAAAAPTPVAPAPLVQLPAPAPAPVAAPQPAPPPVSRPRIRDLLPDVLDTISGGNLHRLQIVIWTVALMIIFLHRLFATYALPDFDGTLLGLMGISSATYLAFKDRESKP